MRAAAKGIDASWDFREANTKEHTHCYHNYPAMMIPQVADRLIELYGGKAASLFDPYCGTGTSLVEANLSGIDAFGTDLNPMARLIAEAKTTVPPFKTLDQSIDEFGELAFSASFKKTGASVEPPHFKNIDFWFKKETKARLAQVKQFIDGIQNARVRKFFLVAFSETVRDSSLTKNSEFKLYRMSEQQREKFNPDVFGIMAAKLARNRAGLKSYAEQKKNGAKTRIFGFDSAAGIGKIGEETIDLVITSPPYGDSKTTVAYGQFSRLSNQWLGIDGAWQIDRRLMGGEMKRLAKTGIAAIDDAVEAVAAIDAKRAREVYSFYFDYSRSIRNVSKVVKKGGYACYVVGNRRVKDTVLPTDEITKRLFRKCGFSHVRTFARNIPNKRMPSKNSPTNVAGKKAATMNNEYIVVMHKH